MSTYFFMRIDTKSRYKHKTTRSTRKFNYIARLGCHKKHASELSRLCSGNMPGWVPTNELSDVKKFWLATDRYELKNGVLCQGILFVLPTVLSEDQKVAVTEKFVKAVIRDRVLPYTYAIHEINGINPHCHLMLSERMNDGLDRTPEIWFKRARLKLEDRSAVLPLKSPDDDKKSGARKANTYRESGGAKRYYLKTRELWEKTANEALKEAGRPERIDCRTFKAQGLHRIVQPYLDKNVREPEKRGAKTQKGKLNRWAKKANKKIESIERIEGSNNYKYEQDMFVLGETKTWIKKNAKKPTNEDVQETIKEFFRERRIEKRAKKNITGIRSAIDEIKKIKETIECDALEWEKKNPVFKFVEDTLKEFEREISYFENDIRRFDEEQKERIEYFVKEIIKYLSRIRYRELLEDYLPKTDYGEELKDFLLRSNFDEESEGYIPAIYAEYKGKSGIIELGKEDPAAQYMERMALARYYKYLKQNEVNHPFTFREATQAEIKRFLAKAEQSDTTKETEQKENQKISSIPKLVHNDDKIRIEKYLKDDTPFLGRIRIGDRYMLDGHLVDTKNYSIDHRGIVSTKDGVEIPLQKMDEQPDIKRVVIDEEDDPKMPKVVSAGDLFRINKYVEDTTPFLAIMKISSYRYELYACFVDIKNYSIDYRGIVTTRDGAEIPPQSLQLLRLKSRQSEGMPQVVYDIDTAKINELKKSGVPFFTKYEDEDGKWKIKDSYNGADEDKYELGCFGNTVKPKEYNKNDGKSSEVETDDKFTTRKTFSDAQLSEEEKERRKKMKEILAELEQRNNPEQDKDAQLTQPQKESQAIVKNHLVDEATIVKQTEGLEAEQEEARRKKARKKTKKTTQEKIKATELDQAKINESENEKSKIEQDGTKQLESKQDDKAVSGAQQAQENEGLMPEEIEAKKAAELEEDLTAMAGKVEVREHLEGLSEFHVENLDLNLKRYTEDRILYAEIRDGKIFRDNFEKVLGDEFDLKKIGVLKERVLENQLKKAGRKKGKSSGIGIGD